MMTGIIVLFSVLTQVGFCPTIQLRCEKGLFIDRKPQCRYHLLHNSVEIIHLFIIQLK